MGRNRYRALVDTRAHDILTDNLVAKKGRRSRPTDRLRDPDQQHTLGDNAVAVVEMQNPQPGAQTIQPEA